MNEEWKGLLERAGKLYDRLVQTQLDAALDEKKDRLAEAAAVIGGEEARRLLGDAAKLARKRIDKLKGDYK